MNKLRTSFAWLLAFLAGGCLVTSVHAASVGPTGYTNDFLAQPSATDWATASIGAAAGDYVNAPGLDAAVQALEVSSITGTPGIDAGNPPTATGGAAWCSTGGYLQTRPTGNSATLLLCKLVNNLGGAASAVTIRYDFASLVPVTEEVAGQRAYYSLTGTAGSWVNIPALSSVPGGLLTANLSLTWPNGSVLYLLWADDNGSGTPDTANQIDNFSATATLAPEVPVNITSQPTSQAVTELFPVSFIVGVSGNPAPTFQWYRNNLLIPGANSATYSIAEAPLSDNNAQFTVVAANTASNVSYSVTSTPPAVLTVNADTTAPTLLRAVGVPPTTVSVDFSERVRADTANVAANYAITSPVGNLTISSAVLSPNGSNVVLTTSAQTLGTTYTLVANGIRDRSAASNQIAPNSFISFTVFSFVLTDVGSPVPAGSATQLANGLDVTAGGLGIDGVNDSFAFEYQQRIGDFDVMVRLQGLSPADTFTKAGVMARESLAGNSRYYASVATPGISGCFFQYRSAAGGPGTNAGAAPTTYPNTFLRLKREGNTFSGYFSADGSTWMLLSSLDNQALPSQVFVGMFVASRINGTAATSQFRDFTDVVGTPPVGSLSFAREPIGPSSRRSPFAITEIMYHPRDLPSGRSLEFIEIFNSNPFPESLGSYRLSGAIDYTFPANTTVKGGGFVVVARDPGLVMSHYNITGVLGPWEGTNNLNMSTNGLPGSEGTIRLRGLADNVLLEVNYRGGPPYPVAADGSGHSLILSRASYGEGDPRAWGISDTIDGSPGKDDPFGLEPLRNVVINEFLAHTDDPLVDYIELYNHGNTAVTLTGAYLADESDFISDPTATNHFYRFPNPTVIPARGFLSFNQTALGFALSALGERIYLVNSNKTRVVDSIAYEAQGNGVSMGRSPDGAAAWCRMATRTPGTANSAPRIDPIVINEIMYAPISGDDNDEYIELFNRGPSPVNLSGWRFLDGITYTIPQGTILTNGRYLVIARSVTNLLAHYNNLSPANTLGDYKGALANGGERVTLAMPELTVVTNNNVAVTNTIFVIVNEVEYGDGGRWGWWSDGGGSSLELRDPRSDNRQAANWADSDESSKGIWTTIEVTNAIGETLTGQGINDSLQIFLLGIGECLVDDVEVRNGGAGANLITTNPGFESDLTGWTLQGSHDHSTIEPVGFTGSKSLHLRAGSRGDNGGNRIRSSTIAASGTVVLRCRAKWIRGWPELLLRLHGGGLEIGGYMPHQPNLGTPGLANSQMIANAGPAVYEVIHNPILPAANEAVVVSARVTDPDGPVAIRLNYRIQPATTFSTATMVDNGSNGDAIANDGIYSATILGQAVGAVAAFYIEAVDSLNATNTFPTDVFPTPPMTRVWPLDASSRECVIRWGDRQMPGSFPTYRVWLTSANTTRWNARRPKMNNTPLDATFVYNNYRVIYNMKPQFAGSPWHQSAMDTGPDGTDRVDYDIEFPNDDRFLGEADAVWNNPGNPSGGNTTSDTTAQSEQGCYIIFRELGIHYNYRRFMHLFVNGDQRSKTGQLPGNFIFEDSQQANGAVIEEFFPDDSNGQLFKIEDWFEFSNSEDGSGNLTFNNNDADLTRRMIPGTSQLQISAYRFMWRNRARGAGESANDYTNFVNLVDIVSPSSSPNSAAISNIVQLDSIADMEQWMRIFAVQHAILNWDGYSYERGKNAYMYKPKNGKFCQMTWDIDFSLGIDRTDTSVSVFASNDPRITAMWATPVYRRAYLRGIEDIVNGPLSNAYLDPIFDAKAAAFVANNVSYDASLLNSSTRMKGWVGSRRNNLITQLGSAVANFFRVTSPTNFTTNGNLVTITGEAPVGARYIYINGINVPVTWTSISNWTARIALSNGVNNLTVQGYTSRGTPTNGASTVTINSTAPNTSPVGSVVFNEILYNPRVPESSYVEFFNNSFTAAFNMGGWEINGLDYSFPSNTVIAPRQYLVIPKNISAFASAFGYNVTPIDDFDGNLDPDGETLTLLIPATESSTAIVVDKVRYENQAPWPNIASDSGISLQLIDAQQDNSRVSNWALQQGSWLYSTYTGRIQSNGTSFLLFMQGSAGDVYIDDITLVTGVVAGVGMNLLQNGDFEMPLSGTWTNLGNHSNSVASTEFAHSGSSSLHIIGSGPGGGSAAVRQIIEPFPTNTVCTVGFWFLPTTNGTLLTVRTTPGSDFNSNHLVRIPPSPHSPGGPNQVAATLPPYDPVWLNELQAENVSGITDNMGEREPWIELYNAGPGSVDLSNYYLANNYSSNLTQWQFPAGYQLAPGELRVVWADGEPQETSGTNAHTNFRLPIGNGTLALVRLRDGQPQITDYLTYNNLRANLSYGDYPDGQPFTRVVFQSSTPKGTNNTRDINVFINEWMAANQTFLLDPSDNTYDDWFELYNAGLNPVDLGGYYLTDNLNNPKQYRIPNNGQYIIPAGGYLLVWADNDSIENSPLYGDLHANFSLSAGFPGEAIGLFSPDGVTPIDTVTFGQQTNNISEGRYADGAVNRFWMTTPTPRGPNIISGGNTPPDLTALADHTIRLGQTINFQATASDADLPPQTLTFSLAGSPPAGAMITGGGHFTWTPSAAQTPGNYNITVVVTDNGPGTLSDMDTFAVSVLPPPVAMVSGSDGASISVSFDTIPGRSYQLVYKVNITDPMWLPLNAPIPAAGNSMTITDSFGVETQRFYRVNQVD